MARKRCFFKGIMAGGLVATIVWLVHVVQDSISRLVMVYLIMLIIATRHLFYCVMGAFEMFFIIFAGDIKFSRAIVNFFILVSASNTVGCVFFVTLVNFGMVENLTSGYQIKKTLTIREWIFGKAVSGMSGKNGNE